MEVLSSATSPFKRRKVNSNFDDDGGDVELVSVTSPEISPEISPEKASAELITADPKAGSSVGIEISNLVDTKLSGDKNELQKTPRKKRLPVSKLDRKINMGAKMPPAEEIEEFFSIAEKQEQKRFLEKYNFDVVKDVPLEGHYHWILLKP